jgi:hypothetical protein
MTLFTKTIDNQLLEKLFTVKDKKYYELGVKVKMLNGSQKMEITQDMLTDIQKELLELEAITLDEIRAEMGGNVYGKPVEATVIMNMAKGYSKGRVETVFTDSTFVIKPLEIKEAVKETKEDIIESDEEELDFEKF